ncbi:hypothetical protein F5Y06DRAFT_196712 [Hypoxylon sp. FL0890]|nr:hypothetical protein F5Y06DRAFT_196712 [Hypoxylon sp. FL0890]
MADPGQCGDSQNPFCTDQYLYAPAEFCCPKGRICLLVAANTTVICCPPGLPNCEKIGSIPCDISLLAFPSEIQSTVRQGNLTDCGGQCCPWGYYCNEKGNCELSPDQAKAPPGPYGSASDAQSTSSSTPSSTSSLTSLPILSDGSSSFSTSKSSAAADTSMATSTIPETHAPSSERPSSTTSVGPSPESNQTANQSGAAVGTSQAAYIAIGSFFGVALLVLVVYFILRMRKSRKSHGVRDQYDHGQEYPVGTSVYDQGGMNELKPPAHPDSPYVYQGRPGSSNVYELSG